MCVYYILCPCFFTNAYPSRRVCGNILIGRQIFLSYELSGTRMTHTWCVATIRWTCRRHCEPLEETRVNALTKVANGVITTTVVRIWKRLTEPKLQQSVPGTTGLDKSKPAGMSVWCKRNERVTWIFVTWRHIWPFKVADKSKLAGMSVWCYFLWRDE